MSKYLVTGGAGFVGGNLAFALSAQGHQVMVLDNFSSGHFKNLLGFKGEIVAADIADPDAFDCLESGYEAIFHEAAITDTTVLDQKRMVAVNVDAFRRLLHVARDRGIRRVVYASSAGVYGNLPCPMRETDMPRPENVYGFSKAIMDNVARNFAAANPGMQIVGLRYFNVFGPGEYYKGAAASMMYQLYLKMKAGKNPRIFKNGEQMRDFVYIKDVVAANLKAAQAKESCVVNVGTGQPQDFNAVIGCLNRELGLDMPTEYFDNPYDFYQNKTQAHTETAFEKIGYKARYTLADGIADYVRTLEGG
ncbi:MAG: ADP-glyceromanno-heptose 6-epimerase [Elusimicrobiaceae bacterium]|nr:ADP-glyceromanno-heptose 6-epimerase [Elusimicrobiaceae bacterium]